MFSFFSRAKQDDGNTESLPSSNNDAMVATPSVEPVESTDFHMTTAQRIDAHFAKLAEEEAEKALRGESGKRNLIFNPDIKPSDEAWLKVKADIVAELAAGKITDVVESQHEIKNGDLLLLLPSTAPGIIRSLQDRNEIDYKANLAPGGRFYGQADNIVTKLIMLKFGFPIAPITMNNIFNAGKNPDKDDRSDDPGKLPQVQRIEFSEKPLEFLDIYNERSFGWKILRRKTPSQPTTTRIGKPKRGITPRIRGGNLVSTEPKPEIRGYIYSHLGGRAEVSEDVNSFVENSLRLLGIDSESDWKFVVDTYNNHITHQNKTWNPLYAKDRAGHSLITKDDTSSWDNKICDRVFHPQGVWRMAIRSADGTQAPDYISAAIVDGVGKLHGEQTTSVPGSDIKTTVLTVPGDKSDDQELEYPYIWAHYEPNRPDHPIRLQVSNASYESFLAIVLDNLELDRSGDWEFQVGLYHPVDSENPYEWRIRSALVLSSDDRLAQERYEKDIAPNLYSTQQDWGAFVALIYQTLPEQLWYKNQKSDINFDQNDQGDIEDADNFEDFDDVNNDEIDLTGDVDDEDDVGAEVIDLTNVDNDESDESGNFDNEGDDVEEDDSNDDDRDNPPLPEDEAQVVLALANNKSVPIQNNKSFVNAVLANLGQSKSGKWGFTVDRYSGLSGDLTTELESSIVFNGKFTEDQFSREILSKTQDNTRNWCFVARPSDQPPLSTFKISETSEPVAPVSATQSTIYGYAGQLFAGHDPESILGAVHSLLGLKAHENWSFVVDVHAPEGTVTSVSVTSKSWTEAYEKVISKSIKEGEHIFVRRNGERVSTSLEPPNLVDIIYLTLEKVGASYWKVPKQMDVEYGINQPQPDFRRAMELFFPSHSRPAQDVFVAGLPLGFGSIDLTSEIWDRIQSQAASSWADFEAKKFQDPATTGSPQCILLDIVLKDVPAIGDQTFPVHYVGAPQFGHVRIPLMAREIDNLGKKHVADEKLSKSYKIWKNAYDRQTRVPGQVLDFGSKIANMKALEDWFYRSKSGTSQTCFEFSAEWETIELIEREEEGASDSWTWDTKGNNSTLRGFYASISKQYGDRVAIGKQSFAIYEPHSDNQFIVTSDMDEYHWKVDVYDWISSSRLQIRPIDDVTYIIDRSTPWGLPTHLLTTAGRTANIPTPNSATANTTGTTKASSPTKTTKTTKPTQTRRSPLGIPPPMPISKFNKDRVNLGLKVSRKVPPPWNEWQAEQNKLDKLQNSTYLAPQPIIEPGLAPDAPLFAESRELALTGSQHTPTVYASVLTPTDSRHLREQNRKLMNQVLDRTSSCAICNTTFEMYKNKEKQEHYSLHRQAVESAGVCVLCEDKNWKFWTAEEKRQHLYEHQARDEGRIAKSFWAGFECPGCDLDLSTLGDKYDVLKHVLAHDPLTVKYCDRCGKSYKSCSAAELVHHDRICTKGPDREPETTPPSFCKGCGINKTNMTEEQDKAHTARGIACFTRDAFCTTCGFNMTDLPSQQRSKHMTTCKTPGGLPKAYCCRCGQDFANLTDHARKDHSKICKSTMKMEPDIIKHANVRFKEIDAHIQINHEKDAKRRKANFSLHQREKKLKANEAALAHREAIYNAKANPFGIYSSSQSGSYGLAHESVPTPATTKYGLVRDSVRAPTAHNTVTQTIQVPVETFKCPMTILSDDGSSIQCGKTISLNNGGAELAKHYEHSGAGGIHGPNSKRAKERYAYMEKKTREYTDLINRITSRPATDITPMPLNADVGESDGDNGWDLIKKYVLTNKAWDTVRQQIIDHSFQRSARQSLALLQGWEIAYAGNQAVLRDIENITIQLEKDTGVTRPNRTPEQLDKDALDTHYPAKNGKEDFIDDAIKTMATLGTLISRYDSLGAPEDLEVGACALKTLYGVDYSKVCNRIKNMEVDHKDDAAALKRLGEVRHEINSMHPLSPTSTSAQQNAGRYAQGEDVTSSDDSSNGWEHERSRPINLRRRVVTGETAIWDGDNLVSNEFPYMVSPRKGTSTTKRFIPKRVVEESGSFLGVESTSGTPLSSPRPQTATPPTTIKDNNKRVQSSDEDELVDSDFPQHKKQKTIGKTARKYVSRKAGGAATSARVEEPKRRSARVSSSRVSGVRKDGAEI